MKFTKLGKVYMRMDEILYVREHASGSVVVGFRGGGELPFQGAQAVILLDWVRDKVTEELPVENWDEGAQEG